MSFSLSEKQYKGMKSSLDRAVLLLPSSPRPLSLLYVSGGLLPGPRNSVSNNEFIAVTADFVAGNRISEVISGVLPHG